MGACASVNNTKANQIITPLNSKSVSEKDEILKPYLLYPYQLNVPAVEELERKYPNSDFVEYYLERVKQRKGHNLMTYEHLDISTKAPQDLKDELLKEIDSDSASITLILDKGITPNESIGKRGYGETVLHYVAKRNKFTILKAILSWIEEKHPKELDTYLNIPDAEGNTPLMVSVICDANECVSAFLNTKGRINVDKKNKAGLSLTDICKYFNPKSLAIVNRYNEEKLAEEAKRKEALVKTRGATLIMLGIENKLDQFSSQTLNEEDNLPKRSEVSMTVEDLKLTYQQTLDNLSSAGIEFNDSTALVEYNDFIYPLRDYQIIGKEKGTVKLLGNVSPYDILPGVRSTKMLSLFQVLACFPSIIRSAFNTKESNPQGLYSLTLYQKGIPKEVLINNIFPVHCGKHKPAYFRTVGKKFWTNVLGKAIAKLYGGYTEINKRDVLTLFGNITPAPVWFVDVYDQIQTDTLVETLKKMISPHTITYFYSSDKYIVKLMPSTFYQLLEIKSWGKDRLAVGKNLFGHDENMFKSLEEMRERFLGKPPEKKNPDKTTGQNPSNTGVDYDLGFDQKAIESGVFPLRLTDFKQGVERIYIIPKMMDGKYTYIPIEIEKNHAEYFEIEITKEVTGWFRFDLNIEEAILIQDYDTKPKLSCKSFNAIFLIIYFSELLGFEPDKAKRLLDNFTEIEPKTYPPGRYVLRVKNYKKPIRFVTLGFYGTDYIKMKSADRMKYKNFLSEFLKAHGGDIPNFDPVAVKTRGALQRYHYYIFKNNTNITKIIDIQLEKKDPAHKLSKIFRENAGAVKLIAKPGESVVLYAKVWMLSPKYKYLDDVESQAKDQQDFQKEETQQRQDGDKIKPTQEKIQDVAEKKESLNDKEKNTIQEDDKSENSEEKTEKEDTKRGDLEIENF